MISQVMNSYAKINIGLRILGKRNDGYHELETIFYPVRLHDVISISIDRSDSDINSVVLKSNKSFLPLTKENLCYIAFEKFFREFTVKDSYKAVIDIEKRIPVSGGMGGGSSNAAAVIKFLVRYFGIEVKSNKSRLISLARDIGSDVPFFLMMRPCYAEGRGEIMKELPQFKIGYDIALVNPSSRVSTKWAFSKMNLEGRPLKEKLLCGIKEFSPDKKECFRNDFEEIVFEKHPEIANVKDELLSNGAVFASMSGSGATVFGLFEKAGRNRTSKMIRNFSRRGFFSYLSYSS